MAIGFSSYLASTVLQYEQDDPGRRLGARSGCGHLLATVVLLGPRVVVCVSSQWWIRIFVKKKKEEAVAHCSEQSDLRPNDYGQNSRHPQAWLRAGLMPQAGRTGHLESRPLLLLVEEARAPSASHRQHAAKG